MPDNPWDNFFNELDLDGLGICPEMVRDAVNDLIVNSHDPPFEGFLRDWQLELSDILTSYLLDISVFAADEREVIVSPEGEPVGLLMPFKAIEVTLHLAVNMALIVNDRLLVEHPEETIKIKSLVEAAVQARDILSRESTATEVDSARIALAGALKQFNK